MIRQLAILWYQKTSVMYLLSTKVLRASPSTSSATMTSGLRCWLAISRAGTMLWTLEIFFSLSSR